MSYPLLQCRGGWVYDPTTQVCGDPPISYGCAGCVSGSCLSTGAYDLTLPCR